MEQSILRLSPPSPFPLEQTARVLSYACVLTIVALSLVPGTIRPHTGLPGPAEHFLAYAGTGFLFALGFTELLQRIAIWVCLACSSCVFEVLQSFIPGRSPSTFDALASSSGLTFGLIFGAVISAILVCDIDGA